MIFKFLSCSYVQLQKMLVNNLPRIQPKSWSKWMKGWKQPFLTPRARFLVCTLKWPFLTQFVVFLCIDYMTHFILTLYSFRSWHIYSTTGISWITGWKNNSTCHWREWVACDTKKVKGSCFQANKYQFSIIHTKEIYRIVILNSINPCIL